MYCKVDGLSKDVVNAQVKQHLRKAGEYIELVGESGTVWGAVRFEIYAVCALYLDGNIYSGYFFNIVTVGA